jgi:hypothetical protein
MFMRIYWFFVPNDANVNISINIGFLLKSEIKEGILAPNSIINRTIFQNYSLLCEKFMTPVSL